MLESALTDDDKEYISTTTKEVAEKYDELLKIIESNLKNYTLNRIYKTDLAILVLATYELINHKEISSSVVINEAVELSKKYGSDKSYSFVNGVLAEINKELKA